MQSDPMAVLGLILISFEVFNLTTFLHNLSLRRKLFCASVSRKLEKEQKRGMKGKGEGKKKTPLTTNNIFKCAASDWCRMVMLTEKQSAYQSNWLL